MSSRYLYQPLLPPKKLHYNTRIRFDSKSIPSTDNWSLSGYQLEAAHIRSDQSEEGNAQVPGEDLSGAKRAKNTCGLS